MVTGIVKSFYRSKGCGFISIDEEGVDVFVPRSAVRKGGARGCPEGPENKL